MTKSKASRLKSQGHATASALELALNAQRRFAEKAVKLVEELEHDAVIRESSPAADSGLHDLDLLAWLCNDIKADQVDWFSGMVGTAGSGPWPIGTFDSFIRELGFQPANLPNPDLNCIVLGTAEWSEDDLADQIFHRDGSELIVLSQPLFVAGLLRNANPLISIDRTVLLAIAETHAALSFLMDRGFDWTFDEESTRVTIWEPTRELAEQSPLRLAGYSVAVNSGLSDDERRTILKDFFFDPSPEGVHTASDRKRWGSAKSAQRLYGMVTFLAWLCRYQGSNAPQAAVRWKDDLSWLKREFFRPTMQFEWPAVAGPAKRSPAFWTAIPSKAKTAISPAAVWPFPLGRKP